MIPFELVFFDAKPPALNQKNSSCYELYASDSITIFPNAYSRVPTGVRLALNRMVMERSTPDGTWQPETFAIHHRCGLLLNADNALRNFGVNVLTQVVAPDDYSEISVELFNASIYPVAVRRGDPIANLLIIPFMAPGLYHHPQTFRETNNA